MNIFEIGKFINLCLSAISLGLAVIGVWLGFYDRATTFVLFAIYFEIRRRESL